MMNEIMESRNVPTASVTTTAIQALKKSSESCTQPRQEIPDDKHEPNTKAAVAFLESDGRIKSSSSIEVIPQKSQHAEANAPSETVGSKDNGDRRHQKLTASKASKLNRMQFRNDDDEDDSCGSLSQHNDVETIAYPNEKKMSCALPTQLFLGEQPSPKTSRWLSKFEELKKYKKIHGNFYVKHKFNMPLYHWLYHQRRAFENCKTGASPALSEVKIKLLQDAGVDLENLGGKDEEWMNSFNKLKAYKSKYGDCIVNQGIDKALHLWVLRQRELYELYKKRKDSTMTADRVRMLNEEGFVWESRNGDVIDLTNRKRKTIDNACDDGLNEAPQKMTKKSGKRDDKKWLSMLDKLKKYGEQHGTLAISANHDQELYRWFSVQKSGYKQVLSGDSSKMYPERVSLLKSVEGFEAIFADIGPSKRDLVSKRIAKHFLNTSGEQELFYGTIMAVYHSDGEDLYAVKYDDGETHMEGGHTIQELLDLYSFMQHSDGGSELGTGEQVATACMVTPCSHANSAISASAATICADSSKVGMKKDDHEKEELVNLRREVSELRQKAIETETKVAETLGIVHELKDQLQTLGNDIKEQMLENKSSSGRKAPYYRMTFL